MQITWYVALPVVGAWGYEGLPAWFRNAFQTYVFMAVASKVWALPWWLFKDILAFFSWITFRFKKTYGDLTTRESTPFLFENKVNKSVEDVASISRADFLSRLGFLVGSIPLLGLGGSALGGTAYHYKIHRLKITLKGLAPSWYGKRIVHLSDLHTGSWDDREAIQRGLDLVHSLQPDLIFFTGDLVNTRAAEVEPWMDLLVQIQAPLGVFSILGNHDYGDYTQWVDEDAKSSNFATMIATHRELGWKLLRNQWIPVPNEAGDILYLVGSENWGKRSGFGKQYGDLNQAMKGLPENS
ncbi:MAG: metallophosphoesterase, partial [Bacteroidota bacterium]